MGGGFTLSPGERRKVIAAETPLFAWGIGGGQAAVASKSILTNQQPGAEIMEHSARQAAAGYAAKMFSQQKRGRRSGIKYREKQTGEYRHTVQDFSC